MTRKTKKLDPQRIDRVHQWMIQGASRSQIRALIAKEWPDAKDEPLIAAVLIDLIEQGDPGVAGIHRGWCLEAALDLYRQARVDKDLDGAIKAVKLRADILKSISGDYGFVPSGSDGDNRNQTSGNKIKP